MRCLLLMVVLATSTSVSAQRRMTAVSLQVGSGLSAGTGGNSTTGGQSMVTLRRTPIFVELEGRTHTSSNPDPVLGAALRVELDGRVSIAVVPRVQLQRRAGKVEVRAFLGVPFFFAPFSLLGAELGAGLDIPLGKHLLVGINVMVDAFFWGSDLPDDAAVVGVNMSAGLGMRL